MSSTGLTSKNNAGKCRFCGIDADLRESHIIPKHFFRARDTGSGLFQVADSDPFKKRLPEGWKEVMLCDTCEGRFGVYDDYAARFFRGVHDWEVLETGDKRLYVVHDYDYSLLKLFVMSVLWRAAVATIEPFRAVDLHPGYLSQLRRLLFIESPGEIHEFGTAIFKYEEYKGLEKVTIAPHRIKESGCVTYFQLQFNEFPCRIKVSNQRDVGRYEGAWLSPTAPLRILEVPVVDKRLRAMLQVAKGQPERLREFRKQFAGTSPNVSP